MKAKELVCVVGCAASFAVFGQIGSPVRHEGLVEYRGSQKSIFETGKAEGVVPLAAMSGSAATFGVGAAAGLDGEITVLRGSFLLGGTPAEVKWHINVDRTEARPIDRQLFAKSKESFVAVNQAMDIVGFYSEHHPGIFISVLAPGIRDKDAKNAIHIHMVTRDGKSAGHIDDVVLSKGMKLFLPKVAAQ